MRPGSFREGWLGRGRLRVCKWFTTLWLTYEDNCTLLKSWKTEVHGREGSAAPHTSSNLILLSSHLLAVFVQNVRYTANLIHKTRPKTDSLKLHLRQNKGSLNKFQIVLIDLVSFMNSLLLIYNQTYNFVSGNAQYQTL